MSWSQQKATVGVGALKSIGQLINSHSLAAPGPITVETLRQGMKGGLSDSLIVQIGSAIGLFV